MAEMKFIVVLVLSLCAIFPLSLATSNDFQYCNKKKNYDVNVTGVDITPYPIQRSVDTTFTISASTDKSISSGKLRVEVKYFFFSVYSEDHDLCSETSCPIPAGDFAIAHTQALPGITPPGSYTLTMKVKDDKNNELSCINFDFSIGFLAEEPKAVADS
nr:putative phosphatidylglycerol/ phosphatidylinositol transfer protein DDB_G0278295 isoform X2 [Ipomoea trifida]